MKTAAAILLVTGLILLALGFGLRAALPRGYTCYRVSVDTSASTCSRP